MIPDSGDSQESPGGISPMIQVKPGGSKLINKSESFPQGSTSILRDRGTWTWPQLWRARSPNKKKNLGGCSTVRGKNWDRILGKRSTKLISGSYLKFEGQNLGYVPPIFLEANFWALT